MKRIIIVLAVLLCSTIGLSAQYKTSKMSGWLKKQYQSHRQVGGNRAQLRGGKPVLSLIPILVKDTDNGETVRNKGGVIWQDFGNGISAVIMPLDSLGALEQSPAILRMEANEPPKLMNDTTAMIVGADKAWKADGLLPQAFTGKGVIAAAVDIGFDFTNPAFLNEDGTSRFVWFWDPLAPADGTDEMGVVYSNPESILETECSSDAEIQNHGTYVLGSMAGNGLDGLFVGMAPQADLAGVVFPLEDLKDDFCNFYKANNPENDLPDEYWIELYKSDCPHYVEIFRIFKFADSENKPCVINASTGVDCFFDYDFSLLNTLFSDLTGPGHIIVASAGNSGGYSIYSEKEYGMPLMQEFICVLGYGDLFTLQIRKESDNTDCLFGLTFEDSADTLYFDIGALNNTTDSIKLAFSTIPVSVILSVNQANGYDVFQFDINASDYFDESFEKKGSIFSDAVPRMELLGIDSYNQVLFNDDDFFNSPGRHLHTMVIPACLESVIAVGAMQHRSEYMSIDSAHHIAPLGSEDGQLASFSSCGPSFDGLIKPDVVAPGTYIMSTQNSFFDYETYDPGFPNQIVYKTEANGREYAISPLSGTSISSPIAAGVIALWLQADPNLTPQDIMGVLERTSHQPEPEITGVGKNNYYGYGEIDAYAGLLDILGLTTSVPGLSMHQPHGVTFRLEGSTLYVDGMDDDVSITVYNVNGKTVFSGRVENGAITLPALDAGVYAVQLDTAGSTLIRIEN